MDGMNKRFISNPSGFLANNAIKLKFENWGENPPATGVVDFDLKAGRFPEIAVLDLMADRGKATTWKTNTIRAHWLLWQPDQAPSIQLDGSADYFFTSQIAGCRLVIIPAPPRRLGTNHPRVMHVAGNATLGDADPTGTQWRTQETLARTTLAEQGRMRALSSTSLVTDPVTNQPNPWSYRGEGINVVGFIQNWKWQFRGQQVDLNQDHPVIRHWRIQ